MSGEGQRAKRTDDIGIQTGSLQPLVTVVRCSVSLLHKAWEWGRALESEDKPEGLGMPVMRGLGQPELSVGPGESWRYPTGLGGIRTGALSVVEREEQRNIPTHTSWIRMGFQRHDKEAEGAQDTGRENSAGVSVRCQVQSRG